MDKFKKVVDAAARDERLVKSDVQMVSKVDANERITKADNAMGEAGVKTPWANSTEAPAGVSWRLPGKSAADWQAKNAKRGGDQDVQQWMNPYNAPVDPEDTGLNHSY